MSSSSPGTFCDHCHLPKPNGNKCCLAVYTEIDKYKRHVFHSYILEALFDMTVSVISVILDVTTLVVYATKQKWTLVCITAFPVLLPTTIFTNVYMSDESRGYCKMPKKRRNQKLKKNESSYSALNRMEDRIQAGRKLGIFNLLACCSGLFHSVFNRDRSIRQRGVKLVRKSVRRSMKYIFGTLVLRVIAWAWYIKALLFGYRAMKEPKKYMKMEQPESHWSRELLIRLDFLQAAMENAPQCIIQLYTLLTDNSEDQVLGLLTLTFSFIDFLRVVTSVFWNVQKGPVRAPKDCYGGAWWQAVNWTSWFLLYVARCCGIALVIGSAATSGFGAVYIVPTGALIVHCVLFARILSYNRFGREIMDKLAVTTFISIFFLPEFDTRNMKIVNQVYSAMILLENTLFIVPYRGLSFSGYCLTTSWINKNTTKPVPKGVLEDNDIFQSDGLSKAFSSDHQDCLIDPVVIVLMVPTFTIMGQVLRMGAQYKMLKFKESGLDEPRSSTYNVEERVATIYNKRWTNMSVKEMWSNFVNMVTHKNMGPVEEPEENLSPQDLKSTFGSSQELIRKSCFTICANDESKLDKGQGKTNICSGNWVENSFRYPISGLISSKEGKSTENGLKRQNTLPRLSNNSETYSSSFIFDDPERNFLQALDVRFLKVDTPKGVQIFETCNI